MLLATCGLEYTHVLVVIMLYLDNIMKHKAVSEQLHKNIMVWMKRGWRSPCQ